MVLHERRLWLRLLSTSRPSKENDGFLTAYFLREFSGHPEELERFLGVFHRMLSRSGSDSTIQAATQYLRILSPLCDRFGLFRQKGILDTVCFRIVDPKGYDATERNFSAYKRQSSRIVHRIIKQLSALLKSSGLRASVDGRYKHLFSIYRKLQMKRYSSPLSLQDIFAFRIILEEEDIKTCFDVLNLLHDTYIPVADRFKDYISIPKVNGYQSIHTVLSGVLRGLDVPIEVQIRTPLMHEFAEHGLASHWLYSRTKKTLPVGMREKQLLAHYQSLSSDLRKEEMHVYCITPRGDILVLPEGSTAHDFAYAVHTDLGRRMTAASVNGRRVARTQRLDHGDCVRILVASSPALHAS